MINLGLCIPSRVSKAKTNMIKNAIQYVDVDLQKLRD
jgi:hypothetical protein